MKNLAQVIIRTISPEYLTNDHIDTLKSMAINPSFFPIITYCGLNNGNLKEVIQSIQEINNQSI
uniref:hypothetical protein n=1 Tax=Helicobacter typhlonius TaxID=76936 RepID=UPI002FDF4321